MRDEAGNFFPGHPFGVYPIEQHLIATSEILVTLRLGVRQIQNPTRAEHDVVVDLLRQLFPKLQRPLVKMRVRVEHVIRANNRRVTSGVAATDPALFKDRHISDAMVLGEVKSSSKSMPAAADNDDVIVLLRHRISPSQRPV